MLLFLAILLAAQAPRQTPAQPGTATGRLLGTNGAPAVNARVMAIPADESGSDRLLASLASTDSQGRYRLEGLTPGRYLIGAGPLSGPTYFPGITVRKEATVVTVNSGAALTNIDFQLMDVLPSRVSGHIVMEDGQSAAGQNLRLISREILRTAAGARIANAARTAVAVRADGSFEFTQTSPGDYFVTVNASERPLVLVNGGDSSIAVEGRDVTGLEMTISSAVYVVQSIRVEDGSPLPPFDLILTDLQITGAPPITRKPWPSLAATLYTGDYRVSVSNLPASYFVKSITSGGVDLSREPFRVRSGASAVELSIVLGVTPR